MEGALVVLFDLRSLETAVDEINENVDFAIGTFSLVFADILVSALLVLVVCLRVA